MRWRGVLGVAAVVACTGCIDPVDRRPGLRLSGDVVSEPVEDWSFTRAHREIYIETSTPYLLPHSVTIVCADADGELFIGARNPVGKRWVDFVERDPEARLKIGDRVYEVRLRRVVEESEIARVRAAYAEKLGRPMDAAAEGQDPPEIWYWSVESRPSAGATGQARLGARAARGSGA